MNQYIDPFVEFHNNFKKLYIIHLHFRITKISKTVIKPWFLWPKNLYFCIFNACFVPLKIVIYQLYSLTRIYISAFKACPINQLALNYTNAFRRNVDNLYTISLLRFSRKGQAKNTLETMTKKNAARE